MAGGHVDKGGKVAEGGAEDGKLEATLVDQLNSWPVGQKGRAEGEEIEAQRLGGTGARRHGG